MTATYLRWIAASAARPLVHAYRRTGADVPFGDPVPSHGTEMEDWFWRLTDAASGRVVVAQCRVNRHRDGDWATVAVALADWPTKPRPSAPCTGVDNDGVFVAGVVDGAAGAADAASGGGLLWPIADVAASSAATPSTTTAANITTTGTRPSSNLRAGPSGAGNGGGHGL